MLLRIVDVPGINGTDDELEIICESNGKSESFSIESYSSPIHKSFQTTLGWYYDKYLNNIDHHKGDSGVAEKLIKFGQYLGDELIGEDHQLIKYKEIFETQGYQMVTVQVESSRTDFFNEHWEILVLPESPYVLSSVVNNFSRKFITENSVDKFTDLFFQLEVTPPDDPMAQLLPDNQVQNQDEGAKVNKPLRILHLLAELKDSNIINRCIDGVTDGGIIEHEISIANSLESLTNKLNNLASPIHMISYRGPVYIDDNQAFISLASSTTEPQLVSVNELSRLMVANKIPVLNVDAIGYFKNKQSISAMQGLSCIAYHAQKQGVGNIIGLAQLTNPWVSEKCFNAVMTQITQGFELAQAVVEARKSLQAETESRLLTALPVAFQSWPLLVHYSNQSVTFFNSPQILDAPGASRGNDLSSERLFGFRNEMLPPLLEQVGDGQVVQFIGQLETQEEKSQSVAISASTGMGKSQLSHIACAYLAQKKLIDFGFYFDFSENAYTDVDILQMIAPVLKLETEQLELIEENLNQLHCCFILDNFDQLINDSLSKHEVWTKLEELIKRLISGGHKVIFSGVDLSSISHLISVNIELEPLTLAAQKVIASNEINRQGFSNEKLTKIIENSDWLSLLAQLNGNPWLIKKVIPLLQKNDISELTAKVEQYLSNQNKMTPVESFYHWQWQTLEPAWKRLLILCSEVKGLLLEMLMTAIDQKADSPAAISLFKLLDSENSINSQVKFANVIELWESAGFTKRFPHGRMVDRRCLKFLKSQHKELSLDEKEEELARFNLSQIVCEGISVLAQHVVKQPNPNISNNLLFNRRQWVSHFERLWFNHDYRGFIGVKKAFDQLLQQAGLAEESKLWSLNLLEKSMVPEFSGEADKVESQLAWLVIASGVAGIEQAKDAKVIITGVENGRKWFDEFIDTSESYQLSLLQQIATFLEVYYQHNARWNDCISICQKSCAIYKKHEAWQRVIQSLKSLARYHNELGEDAPALEYENEIIDGISYEGAPDGFKTQQLVDVLLMRLSRKDCENSQQLLNQIKESDEAERLSDMLEGIQCDIYYLQENYLATLPFYCKTWVKALHSNQQEQIIQLKTRLVELEEKLGKECFRREFEQEVPAGTITPEEYSAVSLH